MRFEIGDRVQATGTVVGYDEECDGAQSNIEVRWDAVSPTKYPMVWGHDACGLTKIAKKEPGPRSAVEFHGLVFVRLDKDSTVTKPWYSPNTGVYKTWGDIGLDARILIDVDEVKS